MTGTAIPYNPLNDDTLLLLFVLDIMGMAYVFLNKGGNIMERIKSMFYYGKHSNPYNDRTHIGIPCNMLLYAHVILYMCILTYGYSKVEGNILATSYSVFITGTHAAIFILFMIVKLIIYEIINRILFSAQQAQDWRLSYFFTIQLCGFIISPLAVLLIFTNNVSAVFYRIYIAIALIIYLSMLFVNCINIIFTEKRYFLDIFLYLCAIELMPIAFLWRAIVETNNFIIIKI